MSERQLVALDSSVVVASLAPWHAEHGLARGLVATLLGQPELHRVILPRHVLVESYSVLTRLPSPRRISPERACEILRLTFEGRAEIVDRPYQDIWNFLEDARRHGIAGGAAHDAAIADLARQAGARVLYTFNVRHFERFAGPELAVRSP